MILRRIEIQLLGPDEWPAEEGSYNEWAKAEQKAGAAFRRALRHLQKTQLPDEYLIEINPSEGKE